MQIQKCLCSYPTCVNFHSLFCVFNISKLILHPLLVSRKRENTLTPTKCEKYLLNLRHSIVIHNEYLFIWNCNCHISPSFAVSVLMFIHLPSFYCNLDTLSPGGSRVLWSGSFDSKVQLASSESDQVTHRCWTICLCNKYFLSTYRVLSIIQNFQCTIVHKTKMISHEGNRQ